MLGGAAAVRWSELEVPGVPEPLLTVHFATVRGWSTRPLCIQSVTAVPPAETVVTTPSSHTAVGHPLCPMATHHRTLATSFGGTTTHDEQLARLVAPSPTEDHPTPIAGDRQFENCP